MYAILFNSDDSPLRVTRQCLFFLIKKNIYMTDFENYRTVFKIILFIFGCAGSLLLCPDFLQLQGVGATVHCGAQATQTGFSCCRAWALGTRLQGLWLTGSGAQVP